MEIRGKISVNNASKESMREMATKKCLLPSKVI